MPVSVPVGLCERDESEEEELLRRATIFRFRASSVSFRPKPNPTADLIFRGFFSPVLWRVAELLRPDTWLSHRSTVGCVVFSSSLRFARINSRMTWLRACFRASLLLTSMNENWYGCSVPVPCKSSSLARRSALSEVLPRDVWDP